jgi:alpha-1,3-glucan synthase
MRKCAGELGKDNFFISGEVTSNHALGAVYMGRGKTPSLYSKHVDSVSLVWRDKYNFYLRANSSCLDSSAFHYTIHRKLVRFLGLDPVSAEKRLIQEDDRAFDSGLSLDLSSSKPKLKHSDSSINFEPDHKFLDPDRVPDLDADFVLIWNHMLRSDDYGNANTHAFDPRNMYGASNQDVFRWPSLEFGMERQES